MVLKRTLGSHLTGLVSTSISIFSDVLLVFFCPFVSILMRPHLTRVSGSRGENQPQSVAPPPVMEREKRLPPPPPPPVVAGLRPNLGKKLVFDAVDVKEETNQLLEKHGYLSKQVQYMTCVLPCKSILQEGPTCGLVALLMAADAMKLNHSYDLFKLLHAAKERGFTRMGEMFSAVQMAHLSEDLFCVKASVLDPTSRRCDLVEHLSKGLPVLVPYDCDKNHDPIVKNGHTAHWATLLGFALEVNCIREEGANCSTCSTETLPPADVLHVTPPLTAMGTEGCTVKSICSSLNHDKELLLFAKQGKSKYMRLWTFDELSASNRNLRFANNTCLKEAQANAFHATSSSPSSSSSSPSSSPPLLLGEDLSQSLAKKAVFLSSLQ